MQYRHIKQCLIFMGAILLSITPVYSQMNAEKWLDKASSLFKNKGVELNFQLNEDGVKMDGTLMMEGNSYLFNTDEMKVWFDGKTQWTLQVSHTFTELYIS